MDEMITAGEPADEACRISDEELDGLFADLAQVYRAEFDLDTQLERLMRAFRGEIGASPEPCG